MQNSGDPSTPQPSLFRGARSLFSPTSRSAFPAAPSAAVVSEHPWVKLSEWWLAGVEGHERKIAVAGFFERNNQVLDFAAAPIAKRHESCVLETENGTVVTVFDFFNIKRTLENGFTIEACEKFSSGFPTWWENWDLLYPKMRSSQTGSQQRTSGTSNSREDSSRFYLERFQEGKLLDSLFCNTLNNAEAFQDSSCLPNGDPRFEDYISDGDILNKPQRVALSESVPEDTPALRYSDVESSGKGRQPVGTSKKQRTVQKVRHATRSRNIIHPIPYGNRPPLTRSWGKSLLVSTPESLKLKKTRSGRVVVPALDPGCQSIVYNHDGSISAIIGLDSPPPLKGSTSKNYARKMRRAN